MTASCPPAAPRLREANLAYSALLRSMASPNLDEFKRSLDRMLASSPSKTCSLHLWEEIVLSRLFKSNPENLRVQRLGVFIDKLEETNRSKCLSLSSNISRSITSKNLDLIPLFHGCGSRISHWQGHDEKDLTAFLFQGKWPHVELIHPDFFKKELDSETSDWLMRAAISVIFDHRLYAAGHGFFSEENVSRLIEACPVDSWFVSGLNVILRFTMEAGLGDRTDTLYPWVGGLARLIDAGLVSMKVLEGVPSNHIKGCLDIVKADVELRYLDRATPKVDQPALSRSMRL